MSKTELNFLCNIAPPVPPPLNPTWPPFSPTSLYTYTPVRKFTDRKNVWHTIYEYNKTRNSLCCRFHVVYLFLPNAFIDFYWLLVTTALLWYNC